MANKQEDFVKEITKRDEDFSRWYTDVVLKTDMCDYSEVKGCMVIKPYGYGVWELIQSEMDRRFKDTGHKNAYFPLLIPESLLMREAEHVEGFAPEVAWVTYGGKEKLAERLAIRPTSETIIGSMYSKWIQSYRDLPVLLNQWCNVMRWEKSTRPFLRTSEFLWQEGHTAHATAQEAEEETVKMLKVYREFAENVLAIPVICGQKSEREKFAGAKHTYSIEAMMQDGKALQMGTSHNLGTNFAKSYDITFLDKDGVLKHAYTTSWGTSTRMIGGLIMVHGDDRGLVLPPKVAPTQVIILPIAMHKGGVLEKAQELFEQLKKAGVRVELDDRENQSAGWKFNECEMKGIPLRVEIGPKDIEKGTVVLCRRDTFEKTFVPMENLAAAVQDMLVQIHDSLFERAKARRDAHITYAKTYEELKEGANGGFVKAMWCGDEECEAQIKAETGITTRNIPFEDEQEHFSGVCAHCGKPAKMMAYFAKSY